MYIKRDIEKEIMKWMDAKEIIAIKGPRQAGKTTLIKKIGTLLSEKSHKKNVHYLTMEDDEEKIRFERNPKEVIEYHTSGIKGRHYFLIDEIQYVKRAGKILKLLFDKYENIKIVITGSSSLDVNKIYSYLTGRVFSFELMPFNFHEFLMSKDRKLAALYLKISKSVKHLEHLGQNLKIEKTVYLDKLNEYLKEYLTYGSYPRVCLTENPKDKEFIIKNLFQTYIEKDIVKLFGIKDTYKIIDLVKLLSGLTGNLINYDTLGNITSANYKEIKSMLHILESTYVIEMIRPFHKNMITELRKNPKVYFIDNGLRNYLFGKFEFNEQELGVLAENYIFTILRSHYPKFWRTTAKAEVDFIVNNIPIEAKTGSPKLTRSLRSFIENYKPKIAVITNWNMIKTKDMGKTRIYFIPISYLRS